MAKALKPDCADGTEGNATTGSSPHLALVGSRRLQRMSPRIPGGYTIRSSGDRGNWRQWPHQCEGQRTYAHTGLQTRHDLLLPRARHNSNSSRQCLGAGFNEPSRRSR